MEIELVHQKITKEQLLLLGINEAKFFIIVTQLANEFSMLRKLAIVSSNTPNIAERDFKYEADAFQVMFLVRIMAGKLYEAWRVINTQFPGILAVHNYLDDEYINNAYTELSNYFTVQQNDVSHIRHNYSFHHRDRDDTINQALNSNEAYIFNNYLSDIVSTTLYHGSEDYLFRNLLREILPDVENTMNNKVEELENRLLTLMGHYDTFVRHYVLESVMRIVAITEQQITNEMINIEIGNILDVRLPYFIGHEERNN